MKLHIKIGLVLVMFNNFLSCSSSANIEYNNLSLAVPVVNENLDLETDVQNKKLRLTIQNKIKSLTTKWKLINLKEKKMDNDEIEIRFWTGLGLEYPQYFAFIQNAKGYEAYKFSPKIYQNKVVEDKQKRAVMNKTNFLYPKSGWKTFTELLKEQGVSYPLNLFLDKDFASDPDEQFVMVEIKSGNNYDNVFFSEFTESISGKKILNACRILEKEFETNIGCS